MLNVAKYAERIRYHGVMAISEQCLRELHRCHVLSIPFESLDVHRKRKIQLNVPDLFNKIVINQRGGYCYELNYLFHTLLIEIGFDSILVSSRIFNNSSVGPEFDHMSLVVKLDTFWLVDVGYGDLFLEPLRIYSTSIQEDTFKNYLIDQLNTNEFVLWEGLKNKPELVKRYMFSLTPHSIDEFYEQNDYKQNNADSHFVKNLICTLPTSNGRKTLFNDTYKIKTNDEIIEKKPKNPFELESLLHKEFGLALDW